MSEIKHSALPWEATPAIGALGEFCFMDIKCEGDFYTIATATSARATPKGVVNDREWSEANAAFIVRACNSHYELLEALKWLVSRIEPMEQDGSINIPGVATLNQARAAIAKAEGRS